MRKVYSIGIDATTKIVAGLNKIADAVEITLGPSGKNAIIERKYQEPLITNDGKTVAEEMELDDELEALGASVIKQVTKKTNELAGDGTSTTTSLTRAIVNECLSRIGNKDSLLSGSISVMDMKRTLDKECEQAISILEKNATKIKDDEDLEKVATVSMENPQLGKLIAEVFNKVGVDGVVLSELGQGYETTYTLNEGFDIEYGFISPAMEDSNGKTIIENPRIMVTNVPIETIDQLKPIISQIKDETRNLILFCTNINDNTALNIIRNKLGGIFNVIVVKIPVKNDIIYDIEASTGTKIIDKEVGDKVEEFLKSNLGTCDKIIITKDKTTIIGGQDTRDYVTSLKKKKEESKSLYDQEVIGKRIAKITNGIAVINVCSQTTSEAEYIKLKIEDAVNATRCALKEGTVKGGGLALKEVSEQMKGTILETPLKRPYLKIQENNGSKLEIPDDVRDPLLVVKTALKNACSLAGMFITSGIAIADKREKPKDLTLDE